MSTPRFSAALAALALSGITALGALPAATAAPSAHSAETAVSAKETTAPKCITDRQDKGKVYTTVWVTNECKRYYRIKLIMARGADSRCFSIRPGQTRKNVSRGISPYLDRIILC
ncbi:hypothetical protein [Actinopolyspora mortivallis]|uniref:Alpha amylase inhibitor n=1 Tax=Actinopolyspora mortivallis TaxID=33906 RepID=A0A2T0H0I8_ACTMO|nr:hypothetical protein [Actinopolyspora mortivallis]PRW64881.1 hypothetical protein CEP50_03450 [Actinopolyspora mortivallis]